MGDCLICGDDHPPTAPHRPGAVTRLTAERDEARAELEQIHSAWKWAMDHLRYSAPEQYPIAAQEAFRRLDAALNETQEQE